MGEPWRLSRFQERLDEWIDLEDPDDRLRIVVVNWVLSRMEDPYDGLLRQQGFDNLWFGIIPGTGDLSARSAVVCSLWIEETAHSVRCDRIATLSWPID